MDCCKEVSFGCATKASVARCIIDLIIERANDARFGASDGQAGEDRFSRSSRICMVASEQACEQARPSTD